MEQVDQHKVVRLTNETYGSFLNAHDTVVVAFVLPRLFNYDRFRVEFAKVAQQWETTELHFAEVDLDTEKEVASRYGYNRFPCVNVFDGADYSDLEKKYTGAYMAENIRAWLTRSLSPVLSIVTNADVEGIKTNSEIVIVGYHIVEAHASYKTFQAIAQEMHNDWFFVIIQDDPRTLDVGPIAPTIVVYNNVDGSQHEIKLTKDAGKMKQAMRQAATPLCVDFLPELYFQFLDSVKPLGFLFTDTANASAMKTEILFPLAHKYHDNVQLGVVDTNIFTSLAGTVHLHHQALPAFAIQDPVHSKNYPLNEPVAIDKGAVDSHIQAFLDGKLKPVIKSAPIPETHGPVLEVVADTWDDIVVNNKKDVLIEYYTQTCGPCKRLLPELEKLSMAYATNPMTRDKVTIGKIDAGFNDVDSDIRGFPTFKLFPCGAKEPPITYEGEWRFEAWAKFIQDEGGHKAEVPVFVKHLRVARSR